MVRFDVPSAAPAVDVSVSVLVVDEVAGEKAAVTPLGRPLTAKLTLLENPFKGTIATIGFAVAPGVIWTRLGTAVNVYP